MASETEKADEGEAVALRPAERMEMLSTIQDIIPMSILEEHEGLANSRDVEDGETLINFDDGSKDNSADTSMDTTTGDTDEKSANEKITDILEDIIDSKPDLLENTAVNMKERRGKNAKPKRPTETLSLMAKYRVDRLKRQDVSDVTLKHWANLPIQKSWLISLKHFLVLFLSTLNLI